MAPMWLLQAAAQDGVPHLWHFWLAVVLTVVTVPTVLGLLGLYLFKVTRTRYPNSDG